MAITVNPPVQTNQVTGETEAVAPESMIIHSGVDAQDNTVTSNEPTDTTFDPDFVPDRKAKLTDPAFHTGDPDAQLAFWRRTDPLSQEEIDQVQDVYVRTGDDQMARMLAYRVTGDTEGLMPDDFDILGLNQAQEEAKLDSPFLSPDEIDHEILTNADDPDPSFADRILRTDLGNSNAAVVVKHLAHQYYSGQISVQEAYFRAGTSGVDKAELYQAFTALGEKSGAQWSRRYASY